MTDENRIIGKAKFYIAGHREKIETSVSREEFDRILAEFKRDSKAYEAFLEYCKNALEHPHQVFTNDDFSGSLTKAIDKVCGYGGALYFIVLEEMQNRHGLPTDWS